MYKKHIRSFVRVLTSVLFVASLCTLAVYSKITQSQLDSVERITSPLNVQSGRDAHVVLKSRNSAVNVLSMGETGLLASSSGTYLRVDDNYYILTVGHGILGDCAMIHAMVNGEMYNCTEMMIHDDVTDYAIFRVDRIPTRTPISVIRSVPLPSEAASSLSIQSKIYYTGYPNSLGPLTFDGRIVGVDTSENIYTHCFAWPGSSGSGVFNENGDIIGVAMAVSVGISDFGVEVLEDLVIVIPFYKIDWNVIL